MAEPSPTPETPEKRSAVYAYATQRDWPGYYDTVAGDPPRKTLRTALTAFEREGAVGTGQEPPVAIDLGCGHGRDTFELLSRGWRVLAIDGHPEGLARLQRHAPPELADRFETLHADFETAELPRALLINASYALPFCRPEHFGNLWARITNAILPGGRFAGQFFGLRDDWASLPDRSHHSLEQARALLAGFELEQLDEQEEDKTTLEGPRHSHVFHVVAKKRPTRTPMR